MMTRTLKISALATLLFMATGSLVSGMKSTSVSTSTQIAIIKSNAANCAEPVGATIMEFNSVRTMIQTGGDMWWDLNSKPQYEVPKNSGKHAIFAGSLWMGGEDVNGQLKLAAHRFRQVGIDYWTGPLSVGAAEIDAATCQEYDHHWTITRQEVETFKGWYAAGEEDAEFGTTTQTELYPGYEVPASIIDWPGNGNMTLGQDMYLAPFKDTDEDGLYDPGLGDYPWYDIEGEVDCRNDRTVTLFGDHTLWWVFNDKGNVHTETGGDAIGMEVHAQAFSFATNDEINLMTFYNYEMINRSTQELTNTFFGVWVDADLGGANDDYVGCDVGRGLGYCYNGDPFDDDWNGSLGYGANPPAIGVDFFEGPYQDKDGIDNAEGIGTNEALNGIGFGDGVPDNERYGMRRFLYHNNIATGPNRDPSIAADYYNYLQSIWIDGTKMVYGGNGHVADPDSDNDMEADFMFPGASDQEFNWGTEGVAAPLWTEQTAGNSPADRRFMQSAGPFTLEPGDVNNITVGVVYARATSGDPFESVLAMRTADDKAQALFDNCFKVLDGPDAPNVGIQELDRQLIVSLTNLPASNNYLEQYDQVDPFIPEMDVSSTPIWTLDTITGQYDLTSEIDTSFFDRTYNFQGYQVYQVKDDAVSPSDLNNIEMARLVFQCDLKDSVINILNYNFDQDIQASVPQQMVAGENKGISHSFVLTSDQFATGDPILINHKTYYFIAIAYSHNEYKRYDAQDPDFLDGQLKPYLASRKSATGGIKVYSGVPHIPAPELGGSVMNSSYGDGPEITTMDGTGNGGMAIDLTQETEDNIMAGGAWADYTPTYKGSRGPVNIKVIDPLSVPDLEFELRFFRDTVDIELHKGTWVLTDLAVGGETWNSETSIFMANEQIIPELGLSLTIEQQRYVQNASFKFTELIEASAVYDDSTNAWLSGAADQDGFSNFNWIRAGISTFTDDPATPINETEYNDLVGKDNEQMYEGILNGTWAPFPLVSTHEFGPLTTAQVSSQGLIKMAAINSIDVVFTDDQDKWTRCPVIEMQEEVMLAEGGAGKAELREALSVDKNGAAEGPGMGMGWFPGYAIDQETGERLNMIFSEDSWLQDENGRDMVWNPTANFFIGAGGGFQPVFGGKHFVYVFKNDRKITGDNDRMPAYDKGEFALGKLQIGSSTETRKVWRSCMWVGIPMLESGAELLSTNVRLKFRVSKEYESYDTGTNLNAQDPLYHFNTSDLATGVPTNSAAVEALDIINAVPNPYYAYSKYEENRIDNRMKITNLPDQCTISIYNVNGTLVRQFQKDNQVTSVDWDLKNTAGIPIAGGAYIIHVFADGIGEKIIKWFGMMRPIDLDSF